MMKRYKVSMVCAIVILAMTCIEASAGGYNATINFGAGLNTSGSLNHQLIPYKVTIKAGGVVNFVVSGFHQVVVYEPGVKPEDIDIDMLDGPLIDDPNGRIYQGLDPRGDDDPDFEDANFNHNRNRVEAVFFDQPGLYLVICAVRGHFVDDNMYGYVKVLPKRKRKY